MDKYIACHYQCLLFGGPQAETLLSWPANKTLQVSLLLNSPCLFFFFFFLNNFIYIVHVHLFIWYVACSSDNSKITGQNFSFTHVTTQTWQKPCSVKASLLLSCVYTLRLTDTKRGLDSNGKWDMRIFDEDLFEFMESNPQVRDSDCLLSLNHLSTTLCAFYWCPCNHSNHFTTWFPFVFVPANCVSQPRAAASRENCLFKFRWKNLQPPF